MAINAYTKPHHLIFQDKNGVTFVLKPGTKIYEEIKLLYFNDEEGDEGRIIGDIMQMSFNDMEIEQIQKEYGEVERVVSYKQAVENECKDHKIP